MQHDRKPVILITNDDGIDAAGIRALHAALKDSYDVLVVAPLNEKSGAGCSLSLSNEMLVQPRSEGGKVWGHAVDGTPADCVKYAVTAIENFRPAFVLSGINRGMNVGNSVFYSGTVAGAIEACLFGLPAIACSLECLHASEYHYESAAKVVARLLPWLLAQEHELRTFWNLNIPNVPFEKMGRPRIASHGTSFYVDDFEFYRSEGEKRFYKNVGKHLEACAVFEDSDDRIVRSGDISLSLLKTDLAVPFPRAAARSLERDLDKLIRGRVLAD